METIQAQLLSTHDQPSVQALAGGRQGVWGCLIFYPVGWRGGFLVTKCHSTAVGKQGPPVIVFRSHLQRWEQDPFQGLGLTWELVLYAPRVELPRRWPCCQGVEFPSNQR